MKIKTISRAVRAQAEELKQIVGEMIGLQNHIRAALPEDLSRARTKLGSNDSEPLRSAEYHLQKFNRLAAVFTQYARPLTMGEISDALNVPLSTATRMVDNLVEHGYAERLPDPQDRRVVRVALTANGKALHELFDQFFGERLCEFLSHFTASERQDLMRLLSKSVVVLKKINAPTDSA